MKNMKIERHGIIILQTSVPYLHYTFCLFLEKNLDYFNSREKA